MKTIVFIETNFSGLDAISYCQTMGYNSVLVTDNVARYKKWFPSSCLFKLDQVSTLIKVSDSNDLDEVAQKLESNLQSIDAILTFAEIRTQITSQLCSHFELKGSSVDAINKTQDKHLFRKIMEDKGVDNVKAFKLPSALNLREMKEELNYPFFIKPVQGHSSIGAVACRSEKDLNKIVDFYSNLSEDWISVEIVVEDLLEGPLVSVEVLTVGVGKHEIVGVSDRSIVKDSIEVGASFPVEGEMWKETKAMACAALDAIGYNFGASHVELILSESGPHLIEVNTRVGGSGHSRLLDLGTGRSIVGDYIELCLGQLDNISPLYEHKQGSAWHCFVSPDGGIIKSLPDITEIEQLDGVKDVWFHRQVGDEVTALSSNFDWIIQVMCVGQNQEQAKQNAINAIDYIAKNAVI